MKITNGRSHTMIWPYILIVLLLSAWTARGESDSEFDSESDTEPSHSSGYDSANDGYQKRVEGAVVSRYKPVVMVSFYRSLGGLNKELLFSCVINSSTFIANGARLFPFNREAAHSDYGKIRTNSRGYDITLLKPAHTLADCERAKNDCLVMGGACWLIGYPCHPYPIDFYFQNPKTKIGRCHIRDHKKWRESIDSWKPTPYTYLFHDEVTYTQDRRQKPIDRHWLCAQAIDRCRELGGVLTQAAFCSTLGPRGDPEILL